MNAQVKWITIILAILLFLSACADNSSPARPASPDADPHPSDNRNTSGEAESDNESGDQDEQPSDSETDPAEEDGPGESVQEEEVEEVEIRYYMTEHYMIRPIDEEEDNKLVLLTFDDGPKDEDLVRTMLEVLDKHEAKAIFFVNGYRVKQNPELLVTIYEHGHPIGNHSWDHINLSEQDQEVIEQQIGDVQEQVEQLTGEAPRFFRPPFGAGSDAVRTTAREHGMLPMNWSNGSRDWEAAFQTPELVIEQVLEQLHPGSNILMHELPWTVEALDELLEKLKDEGYRFVNPYAIRTEHAETDPSR